MISRHLKNGIVHTASLLMADTLFRYLNRNRLLVVMYHGVTECIHQPPVWTQLPVDLFRLQLEFLHKHYVPISLDNLLDTIRNSAKLPERAVLITFDDGLKNNYKVAFPVLQQMGLPATIFLTVDLIGSSEILWVDELYLLLRDAASRGISLDLMDTTAHDHFQSGRVWESYEIMVEALKRCGTAKRTAEMIKLRKMLPTGRQILYEDFCMLDWDEVRTMQRSGLVSFGVHTATHRILSELVENEWEQEVVAPRITMAKEIGTEAVSFCFPNGRPCIDFRPEHLVSLRKDGYDCAFTTENALFDWHGGDYMQISRVPAGNDGTSEMGYFRLNTSGVIKFIRGMMR